MISCMFTYFCYLIIYCVTYCFFFFKQKTAYEMRISDWSSDVCSSDLVERRVLAGDGVVGVVEDQFDRRLRHRLARRRAGKDHVGQRVAAQAAGGALAHHPAHRVDDVGLAAAVRADHAGHVGRQVQRGGIDEGFETGELDRGQAHAASGGLGAAPRTERRLLENLDSIPAPSY